MLSAQGARPEQVRGNVAFALGVIVPPWKGEGKNDGFMGSCMRVRHELGRTCRQFSCRFSRSELEANANALSLGPSRRRMQSEYLWKCVAETAELDFSQKTCFVNSALQLLATRKWQRFLDETNFEVGAQDSALAFCDVALTHTDPTQAMFHTRSTVRVQHKCHDEECVEFLVEKRKNQEKRGLSS